MLRGKLKRVTLFDIMVTVLVILVTLIVAYPLYFCIIASFSNPKEVALGNTLLWVKKFTLDAYRLLLKEEQLWTGYRNTIVYTVLGTLYNLVLTIPAAYVMSKKYLPFYGIISWFFFLTMYVSGGMIPSFILMKNLGLIDSPLALIIGSGVSCYNLIVTRQYFTAGIPADIYEAARIDGAGEGSCFTAIALPLAKPIIAVMTLYYGVAHWNSWFNALIYIRSKVLYPLQLVLRNILINNDLALSGLADAASAEDLAYAVYLSQLAQSMKYSIIIVSSLPLILAYPFLQKYFAKGVMIGAVKG